MRQHRSRRARSVQADGFAMEEHPPYKHVEPSDVIGGTVMNADVDGVYIVANGKKYLVALNGQDKPFIQYG